MSPDVETRIAVVESRAEYLEDRIREVFDKIDRISDTTSRTAAVVEWLKEELIKIPEPSSADNGNAVKVTMGAKVGIMWGIFTAGAIAIVEYLIHNASFIFVR